MYKTMFTLSLHEPTSHSKGGGAAASLSVSYRHVSSVYSVREHEMYIATTHRIE